MKSLQPTTEKSFVILTAALFCFFSVSCRSTKRSAQAAQQEKQVSGTMDNSVLTPTLSIAEQTVSLWQLLDDGQRNVWFSPLSLSLAMRTVADGAKGETREQLRRVITDSRIAASEQMKTADALFVEPSLPLEADYVKRCEARGAELYRQPLTAKNINQWASDHTNGKISHIFDDPMPSRLKMVIANAVWFYADWDDPFNERATREEVFHLSPRTGENEPQTHVQMMRKTDHFSYSETDDAQVITLPYKQESDSCSFAMTVVLPREGLSASDLLKSLTAERFSQWLTGGGYERVILRMPKVRLAYSRTLTDDLKAMGVTRAFQPDADFSGMSSVPLCIDMVKQCTYLDMNEQGTEAAAVTAVAMKLGSAPHQEKPKEMTVNRPYLLILHDRISKTPVFAGIVHNPNTK